MSRSPANNNSSADEAMFVLLSLFTHSENFRCWQLSRFSFCCILRHVPDTLVSVNNGLKSTFALQWCSITRFWELILSSFRFVVSVALAWVISSTVNSRSSSCCHEFKIDWSFILTIFWKIKVACWLLPSCHWHSNTVCCATLCMTLDWINKGFALSTF